MSKRFILILAISLAFAESDTNDLESPGPGPGPGPGPTPPSPCQVGTYFKVVQAQILNFPPSSTTLNTFLNTTVITHVSVDQYILKLTSGNGQVNHITLDVNDPIIPGNHFHVQQTISIPGQVQETYNLQMIISNSNENVFCYQITFALWSVS